MTEPKALFDAVESSADSPDYFIAIALGLVLPSFLIFLGVHAFRKAGTKASKRVGIASSVLGLLLVSIWLGAVMTDPLSAEYRKRIESNDFTEVEGVITKLTESTLLAGNPVATFEVSGHSFEYGRGSSNYELDMVEKGGILVNGLPVRILFKEDKILRIYPSPAQNIQNSSNKAQMATPRKPSD